MTEKPDFTTKVAYDRELILAQAEALARDAHARSHHRDEDWKDLSGRLVGVRLEDRIARAKAYAEWRMAAHDRGEVNTPW